MAIALEVAKFETEAADAGSGRAGRGREEGTMGKNELMDDCEEELSDEDSNIAVGLEFK